MGRCRSGTISIHCTKSFKKVPWLSKSSVQATFSFSSNNVCAIFIEIVTEDERRDY